MAAGELTARTRELLDTVLAGEGLFAPVACASARKPTPPGSARRILDAVRTDVDAERILTPRLVEILQKDHGDAPAPRAPPEAKHG